MTEQGHIALRAMINIARFEQVRCLSTLKRLLIQRGHEQEHIAEAVQEWANYERSKEC